MNLNLIATALFLIYQVIEGSELTEDGLADANTDDESLLRVRRAGLSMLRLGRGLQMLRLGKRGLPMLRLGRSVAPDAYTPSDKYFWSRQVPLPRYGRELELQYLLMNALKNGDLEDILDDSDRSYYGYNFEMTPERQIRPAPRPGMRYKRSTDKPAEENVEKDQIVRAPPLMRYGKEMIDENEIDRNFRVAPLMRYGKYLAAEPNDDDYADETPEKRAMRMLRLGRGMRMLRLGKRPAASDEMSETDKRAMRMLRLGKRPYKMLRLGRGDNEIKNEKDDEKRALRLLRLGKRSDSEMES